MDTESSDSEIVADAAGECINRMLDLKARTDDDSMVWLPEVPEHLRELAEKALNALEDLYERACEDF